MLHQVAGHPKTWCASIPRPGKPTRSVRWAKTCAALMDAGGGLYLLRRGLAILEAQEWGSGVVLGTWPATATRGGVTAVGGQWVWADVQSDTIHELGWSGGKGAGARQVVGGKPTGSAWGAASRPGFPWGGAPGGVAAGFTFPKGAADTSPKRPVRCHYPGRRDFPRGAGVISPQSRWDFLTGRRTASRGVHAPEGGVSCVRWGRVNPWRSVTATHRA